MCFGGDGGAGDIAKSQRADELARQARIASGMARINSIFDDPNTGFNDAYYDRIRQGYVDYAMPQLEKSFGRARDQLIYALDRSGLLSSSAAIDKNAELGQEFDQNRIDITNKGFDVAKNARQNVEQARGSIVSQLNATGDDQAAANAAIRQSQALSMPQGYSPLGQLFLNFTSGLSQIGSNARNDYSGLARGSGGGLFVNSGSGRVVG